MASDEFALIQPNRITILINIRVLLFNDRGKIRLSVPAMPALLVTSEHIEKVKDLKTDPKDFVLTMASSIRLFVGWYAMITPIRGPYDLIVDFVVAADGYTLFLLDRNRIRRVDTRTGASIVIAGGQR